MPTTMPFTPLPKTFLEDLKRTRLGQVVELGCGSGLFTAQLRRCGAQPLAIDRRPRGAGNHADVAADALALPLRRASVDLLVAGNLLRHLWPLADDRPVPYWWYDVLAPSGVLYVFEDEPVAAPRPARNYRDLQAFLARLQPESRRPLLPLKAFSSRCRGPDDSGWSFGEAENHWPISRQDVLSWLRRPNMEAEHEASALVAAIADEGLSYGRFWWARWCREDERR
jgi:SAM-dependent methyltransferase